MPPRSERIRAQCRGEERGITRVASDMLYTSDGEVKVLWIENADVFPQCEQSSSFRGYHYIHELSLLWRSCIRLPRY